MEMEKILPHSIRDWISLSCFKRESCRVSRDSFWEKRTVLSVHVLFPTIVFDLLITGVDSTMLELSLSSAWRYRRADAEQVASAEITSFMEAVKQSGTRIVVQFDGKKI